MRRMDTKAPAEPQEENPPSLSERQEAFLGLIREHGISDMQAAEIIGVSRWAIWRWKKDPDFAPLYKEARKVRLDHLIAEAERRAMNGSDRLLEFLLIAYDGERFNIKQKIEHSGNVGLAERLAAARRRTAKPQPEEDDGSDLAG